MSRLLLLAPFCMLWALGLGACGGGGGGVASGNDDSGDDAGSDDAEPEPVEPVASAELELLRATYLGGQADDVLVAVGGAGGSLQTVGNQVLATPTYDHGPGPGLVTSFDNAGLDWQSRLPATVADAAQAPGGDWFITGEAASWQLSGDGGTLTVLGAGGDKISVGTDGTVAVLEGNTVSLYQAGAALGSFSAGGGRAEDVCVVDAEELIIVGGWTQVSGDLQLPWLRAFEASGDKRWTAYGWNEAQAGSLRADTRCRTLHLGADGGLYFTGTANGGNSVFSRDSLDVAATVANTTAHGPFQQAYNTGSVNVAYLGRLDPADGRWLAGAYLLTRLESGRGNSLRFHDLSIDASGRILATGHARYNIKDHLAQEVSGVTPLGAGPTLVLFTPQLRIEKWVNLARNDRGTGVGAWLGESQAAVVITTDQGHADETRRLDPIIVDPIDTGPSGGLLIQFARPSDG